MVAVRQSVDTTNATLTLPGVPIVGNLLVLCVAARGTAVTGGTGWTLIGAQDLAAGNDTGGVAMWRKLVTSVADQSTNLAASGFVAGASIRGVMFELDSAPATVNSQAAQSGADTSTYTSAGIAAAAGGLVIQGVIQGQGNVALDAPAPWTDITGSGAGSGDLSGGVGPDLKVATRSAPGTAVGAAVNSNVSQRWASILAIFDSLPLLFAGEPGGGVW